MLMVEIALLVLASQCTPSRAWLSDITLRAHRISRTVCHNACRSLLREQLQFQYVYEIDLTRCAKCDPELRAKMIVYRGHESSDICHPRYSRDDVVASMAEQALQHAQEGVWQQKAA